MPKDAPGRNDPCPCGSGKKYKKCCLDKDKEAVAKQAVSPRAAPPTRAAWDRLSPSEQDEIAEGAQELDDISNGALDKIEAGRYEEAEKLCDELLRDYPDVIDGHDRLGMLRVAQGRFQEAADHYVKVLAIIKQHPGDYGSELIDMFHRQRDQALAKAKSTS